MIDGLHGLTWAIFSKFWCIVELANFWRRQRGFMEKANFGKSKFFERILTVNPAFKYHDFVHFRMFLQSKQTIFFPFIYEGLSLY